MSSFFEHLEAAHGARLGLHARNLSTGVEIAHRSDEAFVMASTFKIPIATALLLRVDRGEIDLDAGHDIERLSPGSGILGREVRVPGIRLSVKNLLTIMMTQSDNTATDHVIRLLGGPAGVNATLLDEGVEAPHIARTCHQIIAEYYGLDPDVALEDLQAAMEDVDDPTAYDDALADASADTSTPRQLTDLLARIETGDLLSSESARRLSNIMANNQTGAARIRARLPPDAWAAEKTGTLGSRVANDAGYIGWTGNEIALTCFTRSNGAGHAEALIADAARTVFDRLTD